MIKPNTIVCGDCLDVMTKIPTESVHCIVTSPPYYALRDYGHTGQTGLEESLDAYIEKLTAVFRECNRILRKDGTLWCNMGDSYSGSGKGGAVAWATPLEQGKKRAGCTDVPVISKQSTNMGATIKSSLNGKVPARLKAKDLMGVPWRLAFALQEDGWYLRQDIIWAKPNPMSESVRDRCTKSHEYIFLLSKSQRYYYDAEAIKEPSVVENWEKQLHQPTAEINGIRMRKPMGWVNGKGAHGIHPDGRSAKMEYTENYPAEATALRNKRSVWTVSTQAMSVAHFATFPMALIEPCILAGCPEGGIVFDPFMGAGTTAVVAMMHRRNYLGAELNEKYIKIAQKRLEKVNKPLFLTTPSLDITANVE